MAAGSAPETIGVVDETVQAQRQRRRLVNRETVDQGVGYVLMVVALVATYALH